jgi:hypothetical protein
LERVGEFLAEVLRETAGIDFKTYKRSGSSELLRIEMNRVSTERNLAVHQGTFGNVQLAHLAIEVADSLLLELLPKLLKSLGLTIDGMGIIGDYISIESSGRLVGNGI